MVPQGITHFIFQKEICVCTYILTELTLLYAAVTLSKVSSNTE